MPRGRPKGSKNKPKNIETITLSDKDRDIVLDVLNNPSEANDTLKNAMGEYNAFKVCPRCTWKKKGYRLDGSMWCLRCGQRWDKYYRLVPSADKRKYGESEPEDGKV